MALGLEVLLLRALKLHAYLWLWEPLHHIPTSTDQQSKEQDPSFRCHPNMVLHPTFARKLLPQFAKSQHPWGWVGAQHMLKGAIRPTGVVERRWPQIAGASDRTLILPHSITIFQRMSRLRPLSFQNPPRLPTGS